MAKIINTITNEVIKEFGTNQSMTLDEALEWATEKESYFNEDGNKTYTINGKEYFYDDLSLEY
jgi:hypothetical protein